MSWEWVSWYQSTAEYGGDPALSSTGVRESQKHDRIAAIGQEMKRKNRGSIWSSGQLYLESEVQVVVPTAS